MVLLSMTCLVRISIFWTITASFRIRLNPIDCSKLNLRCNARVEMQFSYASTFVLKAENLFTFHLVTPSKRDSLKHLECHDISSVIYIFLSWQINHTWACLYCQLQDQHYFTEFSYADWFLKVCQIYDFGAIQERFPP